MGSHLDVEASRLLSQAFSLHQAGKLQEAKHLYEQIVSQLPDLTEAWHLKGILAHQQQQTDEAIRCLSRAVEMDPSRAEVWNHLGLAHSAKGQWNESIEALRKALELNSQYDEAFFNLGNALFNTQNPDEAIASYQQALQLNPDHADAQYNMGFIYHQQGKTKPALSHYQKAVQLKPHDPGIHFSLGELLMQINRLDEGIHHYHRALTLKPDYAEAYNNLGNAYRLKGDHEKAFGHIREAIRLKPDFAEAYNNLGSVYSDQAAFDKAIQCFQEAIRLKPDVPETHFNLGNAYQHQDAMENALIAYQEAARLQPSFTKARNGVAMAQHLLGHYDEALESFNTALVLEPEHPILRGNRAYLNLLLGRFEEAWEDHELRRKLLNFNIPLTQPQWEGDLGRPQTLLVVTEQGYGDTLQFLRYLPLLHQAGNCIILACQPELMGLLSNLPWVHQCINKKELATNQPEYDAYVFLMSLPRIFQTTPETIPPADNLLILPETDILRWQERLSQDPGVKIGIAWSGNPKNPTNRYRQCSLEQFLPLFVMENTTFYSLQKDKAAADAQSFTTMHPNFKDLGEEITCFEDTAAIIANLDLVITVDTVTAHLAGILHKPVWLLLHYVPDWRWLLNREDSPWYPSARLFRQQERNRWEAVFHQIADDLETFVQSTHR